jgi:exonuclease III
MDVLAQHRIASPTYPTTLDEKAEDFGSGVRLDYILASRNLARQCTSARVIDTPLAQRASDHLPIVAEFELT